MLLNPRPIKRLGLISFRKVCDTMATKLNSILNLLLIFAVLISVLGVVCDFESVLNHKGVDFRTRVIGSRLLMKGLDPYYFRWSKGQPDLFVDPHDDPSNIVSRISVPPTVLTIHSTMAGLPYETQRLVWFVFQWALFLLTLILFSKSTASAVKSKVIWILGLFFISGSYFWRFHIESGQIYILYVFLMAVSYWILQRQDTTGSILSGFLLGFTASLRPNVIFMGIPMVVYKKWRLLFGMGLGVLLTISFTVTATGISVWKSYISAMPILSAINLSPRKAFDGACYPRMIEGIPYDLLGRGNDSPSCVSSLQDIFKKLGIILPFDIFAIFLIIILLFIPFLYKFHIKNISTSMLFLIGAVLVFISEFFLPANRWSYTDVIWIIPLSLIIINSDSLFSLSRSPLFILLLIGLFFSTSFTWVRHGLIMGDAAIVLYVGLTTLSFIIKLHRLNV